MADELRHGIGGYRRHCRCDICVAANYQAQKRWRDKVRGKTPHRAHGTINGYTVYGCRCNRCVTAHLKVGRSQRAAKKRMRMLAAAGLPRDWEGRIG